MQTEMAELPKVSPFKTMVDMIVAPKEALERLRTVPTSGLALVVAIVLAMVGALLMQPAMVHSIQAGWPQMIAQNPRLGELSPAQQQAQLGMMLKIYQFAWLMTIVVIPLGALVQTVVMVIFNAIGRGEGTFGKYWAAACNIAVPTGGVGSLVAALVVMLRGADSFGSPQALQTAMPSLALLAPGGGAKLVAFLGAIQPFSIWAAALVVAAMLVIGRLPKVHAWLAGALILLVPPLLAAAFAH